jgi:hypothetical protein
LLSGDIGVDAKYGEVLDRFHSFGHDALSAKRIIEAAKQKCTF